MNTKTNYTPRAVRNPIRSIANLGAPAPILTPAIAAKLMHYVEKLDDGIWVPFFALSLFAGLRTGEFKRLCRERAERRSFIDLRQGVIQIDAHAGASCRGRVITIQPNLGRWLEEYPFGVFSMERFRNTYSSIYSCLGLHPRVLRTSFITYHAVKFGVDRTCLQAGLREHRVEHQLLRCRKSRQAEAFWSILPKRLRVARAAA